MPYALCLILLPDSGTWLFVDNAYEYLFFFVRVPLGPPPTRAWKRAANIYVLLCVYISIYISGTWLFVNNAYEYFSYESDTKVQILTGNKVQILTLCTRQSGTWLFVDNAYEYFSYESSGHHAHSCVEASHVVNSFRYSVYLLYQYNRLFA